MNVKAVLKAAIGGAALVCSLAAQAEWPEKPITLVVPWPPGGGVDAAARVAGPVLAKQLGQQVVVVNRPGATGSIGADFVAKSAPDGYTLLWSSLTSHAIHSLLYERSTPFDLEKSFTPVSVFGSIPFVIVTNPGVKAASVPELVAQAKARPGVLTFASSGNGSVQHLAGEMFKRTAGVDLLHVPYKGIAPSLLDLVGGQVDMSIESLAATLPHIRNRKLQALAVASPERISLLPDVPTAAEAGLKGYDVSAKLFALAPAGTPPEVIAKLDQAFKQVFSDKSVQEPLLAQSIITRYTSPQESARIIHEELATFRTVIRDANIRPE
ncbi:MAG: tripartite tricarboxylate transporter substrate binding protein [Pigmentiphaga sp.]|uniref:Bug family tripartite tricarboxylate transporter substrate binding protein n=1 Tax=Pigmentiphaga sp. TaxID=1977564 RepID=UPI00299FBF58|nr:tripartite tricarboxylate transporter substrate binding protein [Pigmentiphaga sp.]MDX3906056.1 tripartite tricarboxylate transporter substrate binding protein [Pigmentiphaga sp.]